MGCPSEDQLLEFVEGQMVDVSFALEAHLDACSSCREIVVAAASTEPDASGRGPLAERYDVRGEVGRGGQSLVLRAYDRELCREIALKQFLSPTGAHASQGPSPADRCMREVRVTAALSHPVILPIHDMGVRRSGAPYYTMPLVGGPTLAQVIADTPTVAARLHLLPHVVQVCQAIGYAHERGFVHRDLKPDNIMVGAFGQTLLLDWGLARLPDGGDTVAPDRDDEQCGVTLDGSVVGTPAYMSPEQASGDNADVGPLSDVWSLGAVLHFVLCGRAPFGGSSVTATLEQVRNAQSRPIAAVDGAVPPELAAIVRRAMATAPRDRYPTATALADDLIAFQSGGRVSSYSYRWRERAFRFARRYRGLLVATAAVCSALVVVAVVLGIGYRTEARARAQTSVALDQARSARTDAEDAAEDSRQQAIAAAYQLAQAHIDTAERERAALHPLQSRLFAASALRNNPSFLGSPLYEPDAADRLPSGPEIIARARGQLALAERDHVGSVTEPFGAAPGPGEKIRALHAGGPYLALVAAESDAVRVVSVDNGRGIAVLGGQGQTVMDVAVSPSGRYALTAHADGGVRRWRLPEGIEDGRWSPRAATAWPLAVSDRGSVAFSVDSQRVMLAPGPRRSSPTALGRTGDARTVAFSTDGAWLAIGTRSGHVVIVETKARRETGRVTTDAPGGFGRVAFSADATTVFGAYDRKVALIDRRARSIVRELKCTGAVTDVTSSSDGRHLYVGTIGTVEIFDLRLPHRIASLPTDLGRSLLLWTNTDKLVVTNGNDSRAWTLREPAAEVPLHAGQWLFGLPRGSVQHAFSLREPVIQSVDWAQQRASTVRLPRRGPATGLAVAGPHRVTAWADGTVTTWTSGPQGWAPLATRSVPAPVAVAATAATPRVAAGLLDGDIRVWSLAGDETERVLVGHDGPPRFLDFSPDGRYLASADSNGQLLVWDLDQPAPTPDRLAVELDAFLAVAFGSTADVVFGAGHFGVKQWTRDGAPPHVLSARPHRRLHFGDGLLAMLSLDWKITVWDTERHEPAWALWSGPHVLPALAAIAPGGDAVRLVGRYAALVLPLQHPDRGQGDAQRLLAEAERAAGRSTDPEPQEAIRAR